jgi:nucleotide-binding universal stress UspA family protein
MYETIVVGTDGSPTARQAVAHAAQLAALCNARLHIVHAYRPPQAMLVADVATIAVPADMHQHAAETAREICADAASEAKRLGATVEEHTVPADPGDALINMAEHVGADLLVVGNRGMSGVRRFVLGSVPNKVSHHSPCNLLIVDTC